MTIKHNEFCLYVDATSNDVCIHNSFVVKHIRDMRAILKKIRLSAPDSIVAHRSLFGLINEWRGHNIAYALGIYRDRSGSVDLDHNPWYLSLMYGIASFLYPRI